MSHWGHPNKKTKNKRENRKPPETRSCVGAGGFPSARQNKHQHMKQGRQPSIMHGFKWGSSFCRGAVVLPQSLDRAPALKRFFFSPFVSHQDRRPRWEKEKEKVDVPRRCNSDRVNSRNGHVCSGILTHPSWKPPTLELEHLLGGRAGRWS